MVTIIVIGQLAAPTYTPIGSAVCVMAGSMFALVVVAAYAVLAL